jgi:hypothetical protein
VAKEIDFLSAAICIVLFILVMQKIKPRGEGGIFRFHENCVMTILESEKDLSNVPTSPADTASTSSASTLSLQSLYILPPKKSPAEDPPSCLDGKVNGTCFAEISSSPTRRCSVCFKNKRLVKSSDTVEIMEFICIHTLTATTISPVGMYKISESYVS